VVPTSFSVVICAYTEDRWEDLREAVTSVQRQTLPAVETIVVIDHNPQLFARVRRELPEAVGVQTGERRGLSGARNSGVATARGEVVAFLDDDAIAEPDWLERLAEPYADERVLGVGGEVLPRWQAGRPRYFPAEFHWVVGCTYAGLPEERRPIRNLIGANMSIRRDILTEVGGFSSVIGRVGTKPVGCEETELCIRARQRWPDAEFLYEPNARVHHLVPRSRARWRYFAARCWSEGLSKAVVARIAGPRDGLASERSYALKTLPLGVLRGFRDALRGDPGGLARATAIVTGLCVTAGGYLFGAIRGVKDVGRLRDA
jgi:GT2 family glycosyltransferase